MINIEYKDIAMSKYIHTSGMLSDGLSHVKGKRVAYQMDSVVPDNTNIPSWRFLDVTPKNNKDRFDIDEFYERIKKDYDSSVNYANSSIIGRGHEFLNGYFECFGTPGDVPFCIRIYTTEDSMCLDISSHVFEFNDTGKELMITSSFEHSNMLYYFCNKLHDELLALAESKAKSNVPDCS